MSAPSPQALLAEELIAAINRQAVAYGYKNECDKARFAVGYLRSFLEEKEFMPKITERLKWLREKQQ